LQHYLDLNHDSGVASYEIGNEFIRVQFKKKSKIYTYSYASASCCILKICNSWHNMAMA
jgi:hypothetical protein